VAPFRVFAYEPLAQWSQTELGPCMNPHLSLHSMLARWKTSLDWCHSCLASSMATAPLRFCTTTQHNRSRPSNSAVLTVKALHPHVGAAMFMGSTHGCEILAVPSLELEGFRLQKQKGSADSPGPPGLKHHSALGRQGRPARLLLKRTEMTSIYLVYTWYIHGL
jgi:hypothetical protein